jgi:hypothetical protein
MATYEQTAAHYSRQKEKQFRALLRRDYGAGKYRITRGGEVHAYGEMPNSDATGWYFVGYDNDLRREYNVE